MWDLSTDQHLAKLRRLCSGPDHALTPCCPKFAAACQTWSKAATKLPKLVLKPRSEEELARIIRYIVNDTKLDFALYGSGCGNSSAADVVINLSAFRDIEFNQDQEYIELGAGLEWCDIDRWIEKNAPDYGVVGARCDFVGVTGSTLLAGLSWLSSSVGLGSDPSNLLDARIVLRDGRVVWASEEKSQPNQAQEEGESLLWGLRGGGGNFGAVTRLRLKVRPVSRRNWCGLIRYADPEAALPIISKRVAEFSRQDRPGLALHAFIVDFSNSALHGGRAKPDLVLLPFDPHGEAHALSEEGFAWAIDGVPGADASGCREIPLADVHGVQAGLRASFGVLDSWMTSALVGSSEEEHNVTDTVNGNVAIRKEAVVDEHTLERAWDWYGSVVGSSDPTTARLGMGAMALLEIMQGVAMTGAGSDTATAWPHAGRGRRHVLQLSVGCLHEDGGEGLARDSRRDSGHASDNDHDTENRQSKRKGSVSSLFSLSSDHSRSRRKGSISSLFGLGGDHGKSKRKSSVSSLTSEHSNNSSRRRSTTPPEREQQENSQIETPSQAHTRCRALELLATAPAIITGCPEPYDPAEFLPFFVQRENSVTGEEQDWQRQSSDAEGLGEEKGQINGTVVHGRDTYIKTRARSHDSEHDYDDHRHQSAPVKLHDLPAMYGANWAPLRRLKTRYDPHGRFNKGLFIPPLPLVASH